MPVRDRLLVKTVLPEYVGVQTKLFLSRTGNATHVNVFVYKLAADRVSKTSLTPKKLVVEDNVGESIHLHLRNLRLEMSVSDFRLFSHKVSEAQEKFEKQHGDN